MRLPGSWGPCGAVLRKRASASPQAATWRAAGDVVTRLVFLNPDTVVAPARSRRWSGVLEDTEIGIAMPRLLLLKTPSS